MSKQVQLDPIDLRMASDRLGNAAEEYRQATARHLDDFADGVARWRGDASKSALQAVADRWETTHAAHHVRVQSTAEKVADAAQRFVVADQGTGQTIGQAAEGILRL